MISVDEARALVLALAPAPQAEDIPVAEGLGRALLSPAVAVLTQPPFDASAMDGYALRSADLPGPLAVVGTAAAGVPYAGDTPPGSAIRIFTGAPVPAGYDRVVMQEIVTRNGDRITVADAGENLNIRLKGNDFSEGTAFLPGRALRASDLGLIAAMNAARVTVARRPRVAILAGGDELVPPGTTPAPGQIVSSNDIAIAALAREAGAEVRVLPLARDTEESLRARFAEAEGCDLVVTIGGASVGDHDLVAKVAADLGMQRSFYKLAMRPGKPLMAGRIARAAMLGLPGNPVSAVVCAKLFMQPLIRAMQGLPPGPNLAQAELARDLPPEGDRQHYLRARLAPGDGLPLVDPFLDQDSARLWLLAQADALLVRPARDPARPAGSRVTILPLHAG
ncbi:gephyrin-like molybdotransferase Glp [Paracoccus yeei]|uniref:molybdopterin molybdotransferase MoeA n=1 Tax=Paracoccus yeei TaxID=147645 RepID=UPI00048F57EE|nr:gephyrin-like molybdotransferase Glp [Paracoccus yeei]OWJ96267.1 molybdopterin molybdenumtransferase MoeA [Paracoccus yeei]